MLLDAPILLPPRALFALDATSPHHLTPMTRIYADRTPATAPPFIILRYVTLWLRAPDVA